MKQMKNLSIIVMMILSFTLNAQEKINFGLTGSTNFESGWNAEFKQISKQADIDYFYIDQKRGFSLGSNIEWVLNPSIALNSGVRFSHRKLDLTYKNPNAKWTSGKGNSDHYNMSQETDFLNLNQVEVPLSFAYKIPMKNEIYYLTNFVFEAGVSADFLLPSDVTLRHTTEHTDGRQENFSISMADKRQVIPALEMGFGFEDFTGDFGKLRFGVKVHHQLKPSAFFDVNVDYNGEKTTNAKSQVYDKSITYISVAVQYYFERAGCM